MLEVPNKPTQLSYKYYFMSVNAAEREDTPVMALLLQQFKENIQELVFRTKPGKQPRTGPKRKVGSHTEVSTGFVCINSVMFFNSF